jgi:2-hydroxychromene-2-carboxylate isomerase
MAHGDTALARRLQIFRLHVTIHQAGARHQAGDSWVGLKAFLVAEVANHITGQARLVRRRAKAEKARKRANAPHVVSYFHQADDPYSHLAVQALGLLQERYHIELKPYLVGPPADWATPERAFLKAYAQTDARRLATASQLDFPADGSVPEPAQVCWAQNRLAEALSQPDFAARATDIGAALWSGQGKTDAALERPDQIRQGQAQREKLGHFMSAMIHYGGEWYWGLDRLHYLEQRLCDLGLRKDDAPQAMIWAPPLSPRARAVPPDLASEPGREIEFFLSFRSPYTYVATKRAKALADAYGVKLKLRFVLPMMMRGLSVPPMKSRYFALDTAREARRLGVPFGRICDPLGKPVERGYALLPWAMEQGLRYEFCLSFMEKVWSQGVDAGTDAGLKQIVDAAGLDWTQARHLIGNEDWRDIAEANRLALLSLGHWGVPCFRYGDVTVWGQDRLWVIEEALGGRDGH